LLKEEVLSQRRNVDRDGTETSSGSAFHIHRPEMLKVRLPTVDSLKNGTSVVPDNLAGQQLG